jgi:hypothetical protein
MFCLVPPGLFCNSCFNLCSIFQKVNTFTLLNFKVVKWAVSSLTHCSNPFQVNLLISRFMIQILQIIQNVQEGKKHQKKETSKLLSFQICVVTNLSAPSCFSLCSFCFWGEVSNSRNSLLGNRKKIAKFLMRTFTVLATLTSSMLTAHHIADTTQI